MSQIESKVNSILAIILLLQLFLCLIVAIFDAVFVSSHRDTDTYISFGSYSTGFDAFLMFCSYFVLINTMIPISLIVSIEIVKFSQSYFIDKDRLMYSAFRKKYANVKSASLNE
jgi:magnesium-transporting ATPase (P-type)